MVMLTLLVCLSRLEEEIVIVDYHEGNEGNDGQTRTATKVHVSDKMSLISVENKSCNNLCLRV